MSLSRQVIENYEAEVKHLTDRANNLGADLLEATRERDALSGEHESTLTELFATRADRDEARAEVVRLGRSLEQALELVAALRAASDRDSTELVRLRTIIGELGAAEAAEPPPIDITPLLLQHPPGPVTLASLYAAADEQVEALRSEASDAD